MSTATDTFVQENQDRFLEELKDFLRIPSISTLPEHRGAVDTAAYFVAESLTRAGLQNVKVISTEGNPLVYADWLHAVGKPTVLCYGHYDVQPADPIELWDTAPFEPDIRNGNIYARGSADDKGQMYSHIKAVEASLAANGSLPVNVKFLIEGEEEVGGHSIAKYVEQHAKELKADLALVSDTSLYADGLPTLCIGLRGLIYTEVEARGARRDLHSGLYGGAAPNPIFGLIEVLAKCKDPHGRILIPGIYDDVEPPSAAELESWKSLPFSEQELLANEVGSERLTGEQEYSVLERLWARPTFEVHGIAGGFTGEGAKTVIPATAKAKVSFRLVPKQQVSKIIESFETFLRDNAPEGIQLSLRVLSAAPAILVDPNDAGIQTAARAFTDVLGRPTVFTRSGGSIPVVGDFARHLKIPTVLMGFGLPDDGLHSPNEKYRLDNYYLGIRTVAHFLELLGSRH